MSLKDDFDIVLKNVYNRKLRSWLTVLGVVIGVAAIIALVTVSRSLELSVQEQFEEFGSDKITIVAAGGITQISTGLNTEDVDAVNRVNDLEFVEGLLSKSGKITYKGETRNALFLGWAADQSEMLFDEFGFDFSEGAAFASDSKKIVIGSRVAANMFENSLSVKNKVEIGESEKFEVVGILESIGNPEDDSGIYMPLEVMRDVFDDDDGVSFIFAKVKPGSDVGNVADKITKSLKKERSEESFEVITPEQLLEQVGTILSIIEGVLIGIAAISLVVGSVGIANSMYTSVLERTKDIGIMKAVGATDQEITTIFIMEAALVGLIGGIIGVGVGLVIAKIIGFVSAQAGFTFLKIVVEPELILFGLAFAVIVGMASGYFPARQASKLKPVDALRK